MTGLATERRRERSDAAARVAAPSQDASNDPALDLDGRAGDGMEEDGPIPGEVDARGAPSRFRRRLERFRGAAGDTDGFTGSDDEAELKLQLMLLREENARLKSTRHQP